MRGGSLAGLNWSIALPTIASLRSLNGTNRQGHLSSRTWRALIRLLLVFQNGSTTREEVRAYQRSHWGMTKGETAVLELSSLAARNLRTERDRSTYLLQRVASLRSKIQEHKPKLVVTYGLGHAEQWTAMAGMKIEPEKPWRRGETTLLLAPHPQTRGMSNADWETLGHACR